MSPDGSELLKEIRSPATPNQKQKLGLRKLEIPARDFKMMENSAARWEGYLREAANAVGIDRRSGSPDGST
jgi:hypothetical protein